MWLQLQSRSPIDSFMWYVQPYSASITTCTICKYSGSITMPPELPAPARRDIADFDCVCSGLVRFINKDGLHCVLKAPKTKLSKFHKLSFSHNGPYTRKSIEIHHTERRAGAGVSARNWEKWDFDLHFILWYNQILYREIDDNTALKVRFISITWWCASISCSLKRIYRLRCFYNKLQCIFFS